MLDANARIVEVPDAEFLHLRLDRVAAQVQAGVERALDLARVPRDAQHRHGARARADEVLTGAPLDNRGGVVGAWVADLLTPPAQRPPGRLTVVLATRGSTIGRARISSMSA